MAARGPKNCYEDIIPPRLNEIREWAASGALDKEIYEALGIGKNTFYRYKRDHSELRLAIKEARMKPVKEIKSALYRRALGFQYEEKETVVGDDGYTRTKTTVKSALPDPASCMILLKHWAKDEGWTNDPQSLELKKKELKIKEKQIEDNNW